MGAKVSGAICERLKGRQGVREQDNNLLVTVFLNQVFCGTNFCSVTGAQVTSWDGERGGGSIWATDEGTTASITSNIQVYLRNGSS